MTATAAQIAQIRRMTAEPTTTTYSDTLIQGFIEAHPLMDELGTEPYYWTTSGSAAPTQTANSDWYPTYDLNAAAADVWEEKAAAVAALYDFSADGGKYSRDQAYQHAAHMARFYRSRSSMNTVAQIKKPDESTASQPWIGNLAESD